jgi:predicted nucleic acid-binding Zn ribbon protein
LSALKAKALGAALQELLGDLGLKDRLQEYDAVRLWPEVVGAHIASMTEAKSIRNGQLVVLARHAVWRHELTMRAAELREKLNARLGSAVVKEIRII